MRTSYMLSNGIIKSFESDKEKQEYLKANKLSIHEENVTLRGLVYYEFSDGYSMVTSEPGARIYLQRHPGVTITKDGYGKKKKSNFYVIGGSSDPYCGYNPGLGCVVKSKRHYNQLVKDRGLIEIGNEKAHLERVTSENINIKYKMTDAEIKEIHDADGGISGELAEALKKGMDGSEVFDKKDLKEIAKDAERESRENAVFAREQAQRRLASVTSEE